jgi:hypothetical protein
LKRAFRLGLKHGLVASVPELERFDEHDVRTGVLERHDFLTFLTHLPTDLHPLFKVAYITGRRIVSELLTREWRHVGFINGKLRLDPGEAKDRREGREFPFTDRKLPATMGDRSEGLRHHSHPSRFPSHCVKALECCCTVMHSARPSW